jgi:hypothetical protein
MVKAEHKLAEVLVALILAVYMVHSPEEVPEHLDREEILILGITHSPVAVVADIMAVEAEASTAEPVVADLLI